MTVDTTIPVTNPEQVKLDLAKARAHALLTEAEKAWYEYAGLCEVGEDRCRAFDVYENVRQARRVR